MSDKWQARSSHTDVDGMNSLLRERERERERERGGERTGQGSRPARAEGRTPESVAGLPACSLPAVGPGELGHVGKGGTSHGSLTTL